MDHMDHILCTLQTFHERISKLEALSARGDENPTRRIQHKRPANPQRDLSEHHAANPKSVLLEFYDRNQVPGTYSYWKIKSVRPDSIKLTQKAVYKEGEMVYRHPFLKLNLRLYASHPGKLRIDGRYTSHAGVQDIQRGNLGVMEAERFLNDFIRSSCHFVDEVTDTTQ